MNGLPLRRECSRCQGTEGRIEQRGGQDCVYCIGCDAWQYNAPRTETGRKVRSVQTTHELIKPKQRYRILARANKCCELCHKSDCLLHVGHAISVDDGHKAGLTDELINSDENLLALCDECNLGQGKLTLPLRVLAGIIIARG